MTTEDIEADEVQRIADPRHRLLIHDEPGEIRLACDTDQKEPVAGVDDLGRDAQVQTVRTQPDRRQNVGLCHPRSGPVRLRQIAGRLLLHEYRTVPDMNAPGAVDRLFRRRPIGNAPFGAHQRECRDGGMPAMRDAPGRREEVEPGPFGWRPGHEGRLRQPRLRGDGLHCGLVQSVGVEDHTGRIAAGAVQGERVDDVDGNGVSGLIVMF